MEFGIWNFRIWNFRYGILEYGILEYGIFRYGILNTELHDRICSPSRNKWWLLAGGNRTAMKGHRLAITTCCMTTACSANCYTAGCSDLAIKVVK
jgi:hypothetical protein